MSFFDYYPERIECGSSIVFYVQWYEKVASESDSKNNNKIRQIVAKKGCITGAKILGFEFNDAELLAFTSIIESFFKNQFVTNEEVKLLDFKARVILSNDKALLQIEYAGTKKTLNKVQCNLLLRCYQTATREYNLCFASSSPTRVLRED